MSLLRSGKRSTVRLSSSTSAPSRSALPRSTTRLREMYLSSRMVQPAAARDLLLPLQRALLHLVEEAEHQHAEEKHHGREDGDVVGQEMTVDEGPRDEEHDLDVEEDEQHRGDVELHREARVRRAVRVNAALVRGVLDLAAARALPDQVAERNHAGGDSG